MLLESLCITCLNIHHFNVPYWEKLVEVFVVGCFLIFEVSLLFFLVLRYFSLNANVPTKQQVAMVLTLGCIISNQVSPHPSSFQRTSWSEHACSFCHSAFTDFSQWTQVSQCNCTICNFYFDLEVHVNQKTIPHGCFDETAHLNKLHW